MAAGLNESGSGVGYTGHAGIGDQGDGFAALNALENVFASLGFVEFVIAYEAGFNLIAIGESASMAGVFCTDEVGVGKGFDGAGREVLQVADGSAYNIESGFHGRKPM